jgi:hypothetical protein
MRRIFGRDGSGVPEAVARQGTKASTKARNRMTPG